MNQTASYLTEEKRKALELELETLKTEKRKEILEALEFAKSLGDLSENAEYHQAREEQGKLEERIASIENLLQNSEVVKKHHGGIIQVGTTVVVQKEGTKEKKTFSIVGSEEADVLSGKISNNSPLGQALIGKKKGDDAVLKSPKGEIVYTIVSIE
ncbi:MAG: transcription elongation factor GreA [bacterium]